MKQKIQQNKYQFGDYWIKTNKQKIQQISVWKTIKSKLATWCLLNYQIRYRLKASRYQLLIFFIKDEEGHESSCVSHFKKYYGMYLPFFFIWKFKKRGCHVVKKKIGTINQHVELSLLYFAVSSFDSTWMSIWIRISYWVIKYYYQTEIFTISELSEPRTWGLTLKAKYL